MADTPKSRSRYTGPITLGDPVAESKVERHSDVDLAPFLSTLERSNKLRLNGDPNCAVGHVIPAGSAQLVETRFRQAASQLGIGVSIQVIRHGEPGSAERHLQPGQDYVKVQARDKKVRTAERKTNGTKSAGSDAPKPAGMPKPK